VRAARAAGVAFQGDGLEVLAVVMRRRLSARAGDASDADVRVLEQQLRRDPGAVGWKRTSP
jgi:predicted kinase